MKKTEKEKQAKNLIELWKEYKRSREGREANVPPNLPVFNATNFMYWLENKADKEKLDQKKP